MAFVVCSGRFGRLVDVLLDFTSINSIGVRISHRQRNEVAPLPFFNWNPLPVSRLISPSAVCIGKPTATPRRRNSLTARTISSARSAKPPDTSPPKQHHCENGTASLGCKDGLRTSFPQLLHRHEPLHTFPSGKRSLTATVAGSAPLLSLPQLPRNIRTVT